MDKAVMETTLTNKCDSIINSLCETRAILEEVLGSYPQEAAEGSTQEPGGTIDVVERKLDAILDIARRINSQASTIAKRI